MINFKTTPLYKEFKKYWDAYPKRRDGSKGDLYTCYLWFKAEKPDDDTKVEMMQWMIAKQENMIHFQKKGEFYSPPKDMQRWLRDYGWLTPVEKVKNPEQGRRQAIEANNKDQQREDHTAWIMDCEPRKLYDCVMGQLRHLLWLAKELRPELIPQFREWYEQEKR